MIITRRAIYLVTILWGMWLSQFCWADVSVNVPLGHWSYDSIEKLHGLGLVQGVMLSTKPFTRAEMARLTKEARQKLDNSGWDSSGKEGEIAKSIVARLENEYGPDINQLEGVGKVSGYFKPLEDVYFVYYHSGDDFYLGNNKGRDYSDNSSLNLGLSTHGMLYNHFAFYINPEFRYSKDQFGEDDYRLSLIEGYGKVEWFNLELEIGRDSLWWGSGHHGSLILTDNAKAFDLVKISNPRPVLLPWIFKYLGLVKFVGFWTELEGNRYVPDAELMGMRINLKPFPFMELGMSRTIMLGGRGPWAAKGISDLDFSDWIKVLSGKNISGSLDTNQIAGVDVLLHFLNAEKKIPLIRSLDIWGELYGEDEAASLPSKNGYVIGFKLADLFFNGKTDLIIEHADNVISGHPFLWYNHHVYKSGYTYDGKIMGHDMGSDARDFFVGLRHYLKPDIVLDLNYNHQKRGVESAAPETRDRYNAYLTWHQTDHTIFEVGWRYENIQDDLDSGKDRDAHILWGGVNYSF